MYKFNELCKICENMDSAQRNKLIVEKSAKILDVFRKMSTTSSISPTNALAAFIGGAAMANNGLIDEREFNTLYPALVKVFGSDYDFAAIRMSFLNSKTGIEHLKEYTRNLLDIIRANDPKLAYDVVTLCMLIISANGKISKRVRKQLKQLRYN